MKPLKKNQKVNIIGRNQTGKITSIIGNAPGVILYGVTRDDTKTFSFFKANQIEAIEKK